MFQICLAYPVCADKKEFQRIKELINKYGGSKPRIYVSEFNGYFAQDKPVPLRHSLGNALINAELIKFFLLSEGIIFMSGNWNFCNEYWGMVSNGFKGDSRGLDKPYFKRPNFYVFKLFNEHLDGRLLDTSVQCGAYYALDQEIPYLSVIAARDDSKGRLGLICLNKNPDTPVKANIDIKDFAHGEKITAWVLNGPQIDSTNEEGHDIVKIREENFQVKEGKFSFVFEAHSLTALEFRQRRE
jgi:hypothetical protein